MTTRSLYLAFAFALVSACTGPDAPAIDDGPDAAAATPDAASPGAACSSEGLQLNGAMTLVTTSAATVVIGGKVSGVAGSSGSSRTYAFNARPASGKSLDTVGTYDVATVNMQFLDQPSGGCDSGNCSGFYAMSGTIEVTAVQPMYRATFALRDLRERLDAGSPPGAPIAGEVTGCVTAAN